MKKEDIEKLTEKYFSGYTDLEEETELLKADNHTEPALSLWARFVNSRKKIASPSLQDDVWASIQMNERTTRRRLIMGGMLIAASIALFMMVSPYFSLPQEMDHSEKAAMLEEALSLFPEEESTDQDIIYEDEMVMIYTSSD